MTEQREHNQLVFDLAHKLVTAIDGNNVTQLYEIIYKMSDEEIIKELAK